ncbi:MAG: hypothetical protein ABSG04_13670 [Verrucomicrobiota bacterium]|jgi:hypothetical protein
MNAQLDSFVSRIDGFSLFSPSLQNEHLAYYLHSTGKETVTGGEINALRAQLKLSPFNSANQLWIDSRASRDKNNRPRFVKARRGYSLERVVFEELEKKYGQRPTATIIKCDLLRHLAALTDAQLKEYLTEAINCFDSRYFRASIVMAWCAGYAILRTWLFATHLAALNTVTSSWRTPKHITRIEDFDELGERAVLDTARTANVLTKEQHKQLVALLDLRNSFAHPSGRKISAPIAEAYLTQIIDEVIMNFS